MKTKNIFVIRHGETDWNKSHRFQGQTDIELNETGREQSLKLRPLMQQLQIESVYSSHLSRAYETGQIAIAELKLTIKKDERLSECNMGVCEGLTADQIIEKFGAESLANFRSYNERLIDFRYPDGESKRQMMFRVRNALLEIAQNSTRGNIAIFTHGMVMRSLTYIFDDGIPWDQTTFTNGSVHRYIWSEDQMEKLKFKGKV